VLIAVERRKLDLDRLIADDDEPAIAAITAAELGVGVDLATGQRKLNRQAFVEDLLEVVPVIAYDIDVARAHTTLLAAVRRAGRPRGAHDLIIAATALATARIVVTADLTGFDDLPGVVVRTPG
jgi:tRNA(fMet)-specific endonuclease VapC